MEMKENEQQVNVNVKEMLWQDQLLQTVNDIAALLLGSDVDTYDRTLFRCMEMLGNRLKVDRVYIWRNHMQGEELYTTQVYEWSGGAEPQQGNELTVSVPFPEAWYENLSNNLCVNGIVRTFTDYEREHLQAQGIVSVLVVPVFLHNGFWGFVGFDDCLNERVFTSAEEVILRSVSLLFANSYLRNEMTISLVQARENALSSARAKTDFLANMSHEIRTPINVITGMSSIVRMTDDKDKIDDCMDKIDTASRQLLSLINDILDMSKIEAGKLELSEKPFELRAMLHNVQSIMGTRAEEKEQTLHVELDDNLPEVIIGDDVRISQILINLLSNAVKFTPAQGKIGLRAACVDTTENGTCVLEMTVSDTGIGIAPDQVERLFSKFEQADGGTSRRFGGTGLGLSISKSLATQMGGDISVESEPGKGSCFTVHIIVRQYVGTQLFNTEREKKKAKNYDFSGKCALLVEDIDINREIVIALLENTGLEIEEAENGQVALDKYLSSPQRYHVIFMDIHMPVMDGYAATRAIRAAQTPNAGTIPIIAMTANAFQEDILRCHEAGMNDHVAKPVDTGELLKKIELYIEL